jgi:hypothetical protein
MPHRPCCKCCMSLFQLIISLVSIECFDQFDKLEYMCDMQVNVVTHQNTLATLRRSLGTMFIRIIIPNYVSKHYFDLC